MSRHQWQANLDGLCRSLEDYAKQNGIEVPNLSSAEAARLSDSLYLAHSTSRKSFSSICDSGYLYSAASLAAARGESLAPARAEVVLGTAGSVFFYVSAFRYPNTTCGFLFAKSLESRRSDDGVATPFDSGGLLEWLTRPDPVEPPRDFLARHELPVPEHRRYLGLSIAVLFDKSEDYFEGTDPLRPGPIGLTGGDHRRWTHEVRIPDRVFVRGSHLQAVFATTAQVARDSAVRSLFQWCEGEGVDSIAFAAPRRNVFEALRRECLGYVRQRLY
jgi:hypothetical protein